MVVVESSTSVLSELCRLMCECVCVCVCEWMLCVHGYVWEWVGVHVRVCVCVCVCVNGCCVRMGMCVHVCVGVCSSLDYQRSTNRFIKHTSFYYRSPPVTTQFLLRQSIVRNIFLILISLFLARREMTDARTHARTHALTHARTCKHPLTQHTHTNEHEALCYDGEFILLQIH